MRARKMAVVMAAIVLGVITLACQNTNSPAPSRTSAQASASPTLETADAARGKYVYLADCLGCHAPEAKIAPSFASTEFQLKYQNAEALKKVVRTGIHPMPQFPADKLSDQNIVDLAAYIRSLK